MHLDHQEFEIYPNYNSIIHTDLDMYDEQSMVRKTKCIFPTKTVKVTLTVSQSLLSQSVDETIL